MTFVLCVVVAALVAWIVWLDHHTGKLGERIAELERQAVEKR